MIKKFIAFIHNVLRYVKLLTEQVRKGNLSKDVVNRKKETEFKNGRLLDANDLGVIYPCHKFPKLRPIIPLDLSQYLHL